MSWQPIETAPRDGTEILIWSRGNCYPAVIWRGKVCFSGFTDADGALFHLDAARWQPLPPPPTEEK